MPENPALTLYRAWDELLKLTISRRQKKHLENVLPVFGRSNLENRPYRFPRWSVRAHIINHRTGIEPVAQDEAGRYIYTMGYLSSGSIEEPLFQVDASGNFRLGSAFNIYATRGAYERVQQHTFLGWDSAYDGTGDRIWWFRGFDSEQSWCSVRDWRTHTYYWRARSIPNTTWLSLAQVNQSWRVVVAPNQENHERASMALKHQYKQAEDYYARWRRRYHKEHGLPDPDKLLDGSDIETVEYITQHLRVYEPPKAQMPA